MKRFLLFFLLLATVCNAQNPTTVFHGGQGRSSLDSCEILIGANKSPVISLSNSSADSLKFLRANGPNHLPTWETVSATPDTNAVVKNPATAHRNLITPTANSVIPLEIKGKSGSSSDLISIKTSGSQDILGISSTGVVNLFGHTVFNAISGVTTLGLDNGASIALGNAGDLLISGGTSGLLSWSSNATVLTNAIIINPGSDSRNVIFPPADWIGLTIKSNGVKDILRIKDSSNVILAAFNPEGLIVGDVAGAGTAVPLYARQMAGGTTVAALFEKSYAASPNDIIQIADESHNLYGAITATGDLHIGDLTSYLSSTHIGTVNVIQRDTSKLAISWKQKNTSGTGVNFLELYNPSDVLITTITPDGDFRSLNKASFGSLSGSGADVHIEESTAGNVHLREKNSGAGVTNERLIDHLQTTTNGWHTLHSWTTANDAEYVVSLHVIGRQSTNGNGKQGKGCGGLIVCSFHNIGGILTFIVGANNGIQTDLAAGSGVRFNINAANIELQVNAGAAETVEWNMYDSIFMERL